jgi:hypothetical protein
MENIKKEEILKRVLDPANYDIYDAYFCDDGNIKVVMGYGTIFFDFEITKETTFEKNGKKYNLHSCLEDFLRENKLKFAYVYKQFDHFKEAVAVVCEIQEQGHDLFFGPFLRDPSFYELIQEEISENGEKVFVFQNIIISKVVVRLLGREEHYGMDPYGDEMQAHLGYCLWQIKDEKFDLPDEQSDQVPLGEEKECGAVTIQ